MRLPIVGRGRGPSGYGLAPGLSRTFHTTRLHLTLFALPAHIVVMLSVLIHQF